MQRPLTVNDVVIFFGGITLFPVLMLWAASGVASNGLDSVCFWLIYGMFIYTVSFVFWFVLTRKNEVQP